MEDFLRCLMSEGVHAVHCAPLPEPDGALRGALWSWVMVMESFRNEAQEVLAWALKRFLWYFFRWLLSEGDGGDACTWKRADLLFAGDHFINDSVSFFK